MEPSVTLSTEVKSGEFPSSSPYEMDTMGTTGSATPQVSNVLEIADEESATVAPGSEIVLKSSTLVVGHAMVEAPLEARISSGSKQR